MAVIPRAVLVSLGLILFQDNCFATQTYIRWGRSHCNGTGSSMVYKGYMAGAYYKVGSGGNYLCLPDDPVWGNYDGKKNTWVGQLVGVELDLESGTKGPFPSSLWQKNPSCAVCLTTDRPSILMVPGRNICYQGWHMEYSGYLVSNAVPNKHSTEYVCLDGQPEGVPGQDANNNPSIVYPVESICNGLPCPPYKDGRELTCVVCSK